MRAFSSVRRQLLAAAAGATALSSAGAWAQAGYPDRPINLVVGYSAGGAVDAVARTLGQALGASLGQPIIIDNRPGAGTNIAVKYVIGAKPDGHTLLMAANALAANMALYKPQPFDAETDLVAVSLVGRVPVVIAANANVPYRNIADLIAAAKARPGTISFASPGNGSTPHMAAELFTHAAGIDLMHVPYKGGAQAVTDVASGQVPLIAMNALEVKPLVGSGRLKVLAVLSPERSPIFPDAPTIAESGFKGFESSVWYAVMAPAKTPMPIVERLHTEVQKALKLPEVRERMSAVGGEAMPGSRDMMVRLLHEERVRYAKLVREANIQPD